MRKRKKLALFGEAAREKDGRKGKDEKMKLGGGGEGKIGNEMGSCSNWSGVMYRYLSTYLLRTFPPHRANPYP